MEPGVSGIAGTPNCARWNAGLDLHVVDDVLLSHHGRRQRSRATPTGCFMVGVAIAYWPDGDDQTTALAISPWRR